MLSNVRGNAWGVGAWDSSQAKAHAEFNVLSWSSYLRIVLCLYSHSCADGVYSSLVCLY